MWHVAHLPSPLRAGNVTCSGVVPVGPVVSAACSWRKACRNRLFLLPMQCQPRKATRPVISNANNLNADASPNPDKPELPMDVHQTGIGNLIPRATLAIVVSVALVGAINCSRALPSAATMVPTAAAARSHARPVATVTAASGDSFLETAQYQMMKAFSLPTFGKVALLALCAVPLVYMGALLYSTKTNSEWSFSLWRTYCVVADVMDMEEKAGSFDARVILATVHMIGVFTFASLIGILANDASDAMEKMSKGNFNLRENQHTVLLGWNKHTVPMLKQILVAQKERKSCAFTTPIVVLADKDKEDMDDELADAIGSEAVKVMTRSGNPLRVSDMERVAAGRARTVIVMSPEEEHENLTSEAGVAVILANLNSMSSTKQSIILETSGIDHDGNAMQDTAAEIMLKAIRMKDDSTVSFVPGLHNLQDVMAQSVMQPGLGNVLHQLCIQSSEHSELYVQRYPELVGRTFGEARHRFDNATLCGVVHAKTGAHILNPAESYIISADDHAVLLAEDSSKLTLRSTPYETPALPSNLVKGTTGVSARKVVVVSYSPDVSQLVRHLKAYAPKGSQITVLTSSGNPDGRSGGVKYVSGNLTSTQTMVDAGVCEADSLIILGEGAGEDCVDDAQIVATVLQVQGALAASKAPRAAPLGLVCCIHDPDTTNILKQVADMPGVGGQAIHLDIIEHRQILGGMVTQIAAEPLLEPVFVDLFGKGGVEVQLRSLAKYGVLAGEDFTWGQLQELARAKGDLLIGYIDRSGDEILGVSRSSQVTMQDGDNFVVLGESV